MSNKEKSEQKKKVLVFGVFDRLHPGHVNFLRQASAFGNVTAVVARDSTVRELKNKIPVQDEQTRMEALEKVSFVNGVCLGDTNLGTYEAIHAIAPDVICLGYDQDALFSDLRERIKKKEIPEIPLVCLEAHFPQKYSSSRLRNP